jgi:hypothetical protein
MYNVIATRNADDAEIVAFCENEIALLDKRKGGSKTPTKNQKENEGIKDVILEVLAEADRPMTVTELIADDRLNAYTNQKVSALLRQLKEAKIVAKTIEKKKAYFAVAE